jgi:hypothetical protein
MKKITIPLTRTEWQRFTAILLEQSEDCAPKRIGHLNYKERYSLAMRNDLLKCAYIKLHNKLHSLKDDKNNLNLTVSEAAAVGLFFQETDIKYSFTAYIKIIGIIDQKLA